MSAVLMIAIGACQKNRPNPITGFTGFSAKASDYYDSISIQDGLLRFETRTCLISVLEELQAEVLFHHDTFTETWGHLGEDEYHAKVLELGFDEEQPLIDFENHFGLTSLRHVIRAAEEAWLDAGGDTAGDPDSYFIPDQFIRTLLNQANEFDVSDTIYKLVEHGWFAVHTGGYTTLVALRAWLDSVESDQVPLPDHLSGKVSSHMWIPINCYCLGKKDDFAYNTAGDRKIKWEVSHICYPIVGPVARAETTNYRKRTNGNWIKTEATTYVRVWGNHRPDGNPCGDIRQFDTGTIGLPNSKSWAMSVRVGKTQYGWVNGYHKGVANIEYTSNI